MSDELTHTFENSGSGDPGTGKFRIKNSELPETIMELIDDPASLTKEDLELIMKLDAEEKGLMPHNCPKCETLNFLKVGDNHCVNCQNEIWRKTV